MTRKRKYVARRYTEYIIQSYVKDGDGEWKYETNVEIAPSFKEAKAMMCDYREGRNLPSEFGYHLEDEARAAAQQPSRGDGLARARGGA